MVKAQKWIRSPEKKRDWSQLFPEVMQSVFEGLSYTDFLRARSVCSAWYSASKPCIPKPDLFPWLILFPQETGDNNSSCLLFNPGDDKIYRMKDPGDDFAKGRCMATSGNWLLFLDARANFYILNLLTREKIDLPPVESLDGMLVIERRGDYEFFLTRRGAGQRPLKNSAESLCQWIIRAVLWVDETTKDYLVIWRYYLFRYYEDYTVFCRKGDDRWREIPMPNGHLKCLDMVYKNNKLYVYGDQFFIRIWDFSGDFPMETTNFPALRFDVGSVGSAFNCIPRIAVTMSGDILMVVIRKPPVLRFFEVFKINPQGTEWECIDSLGDEALILDQGITVSTKDISGIKSGSIYFSCNHDDYPFLRGDVSVFDLRTETTTWFEKLDSVSGSCQDAWWFFPRLGEMIDQQLRR